MIQALTTVAYAVVTVVCARGALSSYHHRGILAGIALHMLIVTLRTGLLVALPESQGWDWNSIHRLTIATAGIVGLYEWWKGGSYGKEA